MQLDSVIADIGDVEQRVLGQLLLHAEEVILDVAVLVSFGTQVMLSVAGLKVVTRPVGNPWSAVT